MIPEPLNRSLLFYSELFTYRDHNQVERRICRLKQLRCVAIRCDRLADSCALIVQLRASTIWPIREHTLGIFALRS